MKRLLMWLGGIFLVIVVLVGIGIAYVAINGNALDHESKAYADAAIPAIVAGWNESELEQRLSAEARSSTHSGDLDKLFGMFRRLGNLKHYDGAKGEARISVTTQNGRLVTADYVGTAEFDAGAAQIALRLIKHGDQWQILAFRVNSPAFLH